LRGIFYKVPHVFTESSRTNRLIGNTDRSIRSKDQQYAKFFSDRRYGDRLAALDAALEWRNATEWMIGKPRREGVGNTKPQTRPAKAMPSRSTPAVEGFETTKPQLI